MGQKRKLDGPTLPLDVKRQLINDLTFNGVAIIKKYADTASRAPPDSMWMLQRSICEEIEQESARRTPRYLFRAWSEVSGGSAGLNTRDAITPLAFYTPRNQITSDALPSWHRGLRKVAENAANHLKDGRDLPATYFSSWSQSLEFVLWFTQQVPGKDHHISILDTSALRKFNKENIILFTPSMHARISKTILSYQFEFLIYGIIDGASYKSVPLQQFRSNGVDVHGLRGKPIEVAITSAQAIGRLFGPQYGLAMITALLASHRTYIWTILERLEEHKIPAEWIDELSDVSHTLIRPQDIKLIYDTGSIQDCARAISLRRALTLYSLYKNNDVKKQRAARRVERDIRVSEELDDEIRSLHHDEGYGGSDGQKVLEESGRLALLRNNLTIDMEGWTEEDFTDLPRKMRRMKITKAPADNV